MTQSSPLTSTTRPRETSDAFDDSYLEETELALHWYDRVIHEFPATDAAELAYRKKLFVLIGYREPGEHGRSWGVKEENGSYCGKVFVHFALLNHPVDPAFDPFKVFIGLRRNSSERSGNSVKSRES
jgi:hypothetical protein